MTPHRPRHLPRASLLALALLFAVAGCGQSTAPEAAAPSAAVDPPAADAPPAAAPATAPATALSSEQLETLAAKIVTQSARVAKGEIVWITGRQQDAEFLEDLAVNVGKQGAFPLVEYGSDRLSKRLFFDVPAEYDSVPDRVAMLAANNADVWLEVSNNTSEDLFANADPARVAARSKASEATQKAFVDRGGRLVEIGNGLYPTPWRAERMGMSEAALSELFWKGVDADYAGLQAQGARLQAALAAADQVHVTDGNGTDFTVSLKGRPVIVSDGVAADGTADSPARMAYLPAGEVYAAPVAGTASGTIVEPHGYYQGEPVENLTLTFKDGMLTAITGEGDGFAPMKAVYDAIDDGRKNRFGFIDIGINPNVRLPDGSRVGNWVPAGTVSLGTGNNLWAGGDNAVQHGFSVSLRGATVTVDGKPLVENGELKP